ncbi:DegT/DnrJ/EryC1/StrS family aminotransferase [Aestuariibaculum suncheonense]|uniref:Aminotransferase class I/II-fold pyridoxal phosphate-dependent enzyme n=1 Tax=Aestuariibaculum suncheonense TaxID=1028745 RepID=A0A8J6QEK0_9FLAO|nr:aminotransferase class I/II-fold pyridoxal phosphate-dependent enzyme [Aestuariibaculum suncheonense]MBD0835505.1 aminotransferase class I/II-fold pyridoxal phosphate-dependent enzyme [Aestuariibaculum suncheonense]
MTTKKKIFLSPPHMSGLEQDYVKHAFETNWVAPMGDNINDFEKDLQDFLGVDTYPVALNSGTSAIHLALILLGVSAGDEVLCQSFTFSASINPVVYQGGKPVFVDSESITWNMSPELLEIAIKDRISKHKKPKAIIAVHLYGMPYQADKINAIARQYEIPVIEDAAEALGSCYHGKPCGNLSDIGVLSFNGNKIITTSVGGALVVKDSKLKDNAIFLSNQAKDKATHYEHSQIGYNYRMSNVLAGIGRGQMKVLKNRVEARRNNFNFYKSELSKFAEITFLEEPENFKSNRWLTCITTESFDMRERIRLALEKENIESRPLWKPMHLQPVFKDCLSFTNGISEHLFETGLCLPSGSNLSQEDLGRIVGVISKTL